MRTQPRFNLYVVARATDQLRPARGRGLNLQQQIEARAHEPGLNYLHPTKGWRRISPKRAPWQQIFGAKLILPEGKPHNRRERRRAAALKRAA